MNQEILINAVRASKRRPMSFSSIGDLQGTLKRNASLSASLPFANGDLNSFSLAPKVDGGLSDLSNYGNLNTKDFYTKLQNEIKPELFKYYYDNNWPRGFLYSIFVAKFVINGKDNNKIIRAVSKKCKTKIDQGRCKAIQEDFEFVINNSDENLSCELAARDMVGNSVNNKPVTYFNGLRNRCTAVKFDFFVTALRILRYEPITSTATTKAKVTKRTETKISTNKERGVRLVTVSEPKTSASIQFASQELNVPKLSVKMERVETGAVHLRSPDAMLNFLGEAIAVQNYFPPDQSYAPTVRVGLNYEKAKLFNVVRGADSSAVVTVRDELDGDLFSIPRPNYGAENEDKTLSAITLINQIIARQTLSKDLPKASTITLNPS
jgi:hypothetical protein